MPQLVRNPPFYFHSARYHNSRLRLLPCCNMINETQGNSCNNWIQQSSLARVVLSVWCNCLFGNAQIEHECWYRNCIFSFECVFWVKGRAEARVGACKLYIVKSLLGSGVLHKTDAALLCASFASKSRFQTRHAAILVLCVPVYWTSAVQKVPPSRWKPFSTLPRLATAQKAKAVFLHS